MISFYFIDKTAGGPSDTDTGITLVSSPVMAIPSADDGPSEVRVNGVWSVGVVNC